MLAAASEDRGKTNRSGYDHQGTWRIRQGGREIGLNGNSGPQITQFEMVAGPFAEYRFVTDGIVLLSGYRSVYECYLLQCTKISALAILFMQNPI